MSKPPSHVTHPEVDVNFARAIKECDNDPDALISLFEKIALCKTCFCKNMNYVLLLLLL